MGRRRGLQAENQVATMDFMQPRLDGDLLDSDVRPESEEFVRHVEEGCGALEGHV